MSAEIKLNGVRLFAPEQMVRIKVAPDIHATVRSVTVFSSGSVSYTCAWIADGKLNVEDFKSYEVEGAQP